MPKTAADARPDLPEDVVPLFGGFPSARDLDDNAGKEAAMDNARELRQRAQEHRAAAREAQDLWESVIRFNLAARYDELAARRDSLGAGSRQAAPRLERVG
jgi:hypothetical protein